MPILPEARYVDGKRCHSDTPKVGNALDARFYPICCEESCQISCVSVHDYQNLHKRSFHQSAQDVTFKLQKGKEEARGLGSRQGSSTSIAQKPPVHGLDWVGTNILDK
jgi:hypothetical protein